MEFSNHSGTEGLLTSEARRLLSEVRVFCSDSATRSVRHVRQNQKFRMSTEKKAAIVSRIDRGFSGSEASHLGGLAIGYWATGSAFVCSSLDGVELAGSADRIFTSTFRG